MPETRCDVYESREVYSINLEDVRDVGLQGNGYTYGIKYEVYVGYDFRDC
jgi:hypothetical protein